MNGNGIRALGVIAVGAVWLTPALAHGELPPVIDGGLDVRAVFAAKCAACHGPDLPKPKGRFGYVLDLARVSGNREMVVPFVPDESELWELVRRGEMPPADSPSGPLTAEQKELIRAWIAAGAPAEAAPPERQDHEQSPEDMESAVKRTLGRLGPLHILVIHFPIALLIAAVAAELWSAWQGDRTPAPAVRFCVLLGAASAVVAAALGWLHAAHGHGATMPHVLTLHAWSGTLAAAWAVGTALFSEWDERRRVRSLRFRAWLIVGSMLVAIASHFGGTLVHGADFLTRG